MLGIGMQEILIILVVALIVIGPKRLPDLAKTLGKGFAEFRKAADDLQDTVRMDLQKERTEEFKQKYPDLVPDEDEDTTEPEPSSDPGSTDEPVKSEPAPSGVEGSAPEPDHAAMDGSTENEPVPGPAGGGIEEPKPSYDPEEIEGGDETEDDTRDA